MWDGIRPLAPRDLVSRHEVEIGTLGLVAATEKLVRPTDWAFEEAHHTIVVHLGGRLDRMECEFSVGPSGRVLPERGDIWMIPAACRYAALAQGERAEFVEFRVPTAMLGDAPIEARVQHRDDFIFGSAARLAELVQGPGGDLSDMASHAIADALQMHLLARYGAGTASARRRGLSASDRARLVDAIKSQLDAPHSLDGLAALVGMDARRFTGAFRAAFGLSPWQYVLRARLDAAARMLRQGAEPVTEVALATGFATPSHFATAFARRFGAAPSRWRAAAR
ncbi:helix-turn-helix domain-containing protein [Sphingopyxis sp.]|uniref:helix-turn-helix domain-containing protein n=1 Tax=Sphingopyxis sp. TaxID=1908224 RepID=UPI003D138042